MTVTQYDVVELKDGRTGTVVEIFDFPHRGYMVEIADKRGVMIDDPIVTEDKIQAVIWRRQ